VRGRGEEGRRYWQTLESVENAEDHSSVDVSRGGRS
jgi:hypothetical protein